MTPAYAVLTLLGIALVVLPAVVGVCWWAGTRLIGRSRRGPPVALEEVAPLSQLDLSGLASSQTLEALSPRERQFVSRTVGGRLDGRLTPIHALADARAAARSAAKRGGAPPADREVPVAAFILVCPACGASLGTSADVAHYVGSCPACSRRVASRRRGSRIALE